MSNNGRGRLFVLAGPSGSGKTTLARHLVETFREAVFSVSATTRPIRKGERENVDYLFMNESEFRRKVEEGFFLEHAEVHGNLYGTPRREVIRELEAGRSVILDIDVRGALSVKKLFPRAELIFILPPGRDVLIRRLKARNTDGDRNLEVRLETATWEVKWIGYFDFFLRNDDLEDSRKKIEAIFLGASMKLDGIPFPGEILEMVPGGLTGLGYWKGKRVVVTSGPTREPIDSVRFISNRSGGLMGRSLARAFRDAGSEVIEVSGPSAVLPAWGVATVNVETAEEMLDALLKVVPGADLLVMSAAVSDFRPVEVVSGKLARSGSLVVKMEATPDIIISLGEKVETMCPVLAFALEYGSDGVEKAWKKLKRKGAEAVFYNPGDVMGAGMESGANEGELLFSDGSSMKVNRASKRYVAMVIASAMGDYMRRKDDS